MQAEIDETEAKAPTLSSIEAVSSQSSSFLGHENTGQGASLHPFKVLDLYIVKILFFKRRYLFFFYLFFCLGQRPYNNPFSPPSFELGFNSHTHKKKIGGKKERDYVEV